MRKLLPILFLLAASSGLAQAQQTVITKLFSGVSTPTQTAPVQNIGQTIHLVSLTVNLVAGTVNFRAELEYSFDNMNWSPFGSPQGGFTQTYTALGTYTQLYTGTGTYPYVRFNLISSASTNTNYTAWYTASVSGGTPAPNSSCSSNPLATNQINVPAGTTVQVIPNPPTGHSNYVCGFVLTLSASGTAQFTTGSGTNCSTGPFALTPNFNLLAGTPLTSPPVYGGAAMAGQTNGGICVTTAGGAAQVFVVYVTI